MARLGVLARYVLLPRQYFELKYDTAAVHTAV